MRNTGIHPERLNSDTLSGGFVARNGRVFSTVRFRASCSVLVLCLLVIGCESTPHHHHAPVVDNSMAERNEAGPPAEAPVQQPIVYIVKKGDTLYSIAQSQGINQGDLAEWNNIQDPRAIHIGQQLSLSSPSQSAQPALFPVQEPESPTAAIASPIGPPPGTKHLPNTNKLKTEPKAFKLPYSEQAMAQLKKGLLEMPPAVMTVNVDPTPETKTDGGINSVQPVPPATEIIPDADRVEWTWPTKGKVAELFSESTKGIDIVGRQGQEVTASAGGKVVYSGAGLRGYGKLVIIKHNNTYLSAYAHNNKLLVKEGQTVVKGQKIAEMGNSDSSLVKLHFEIRKNGKPVDPLKHLPGISG
ncbi:peptidoglycan DD-metalloendopeptidase family protein [Nitrosospira briensis]|uniref:Lipoprotein NlpD n=1 Tax=Nitrosospira briensis TaxID=35799 RepID=A0A1I5AH06_9PROT|nr:peptidoglycan DD-metalloendopeptidase family protein [Nitrosospira briensis]SFN61672.1 lipoprotein NlpD [Nitrosospira briensis]SFN90361.1 lipoprotein NlpD [Nitrosospira briensis]